MMFGLMLAAALSAPEISWSVFHPEWPDLDYFKRVVQKADEYGHVDSFEACGRCGHFNGGLNGFLLYEPYPSAAKDVDRDWVMKNRKLLGDIVEVSHKSGRPFYYWHREIFMPKGVLKDVPELKDADGEFDLMGEAYAKYLRWKVDAAFKAVPALDGIVLTLTEADFSVIHNSNQDRYPPEKVVEKIVRIFAEEHERLGKRLIVRSFGSIAPDYEQIIAGSKAAAKDHRFEVETKATAYDFDPFLPNNPFLRKIPGTTLGTECDGLGEYFGAGYFPAAQVPVIHRYVRDAREQDADRYTIRIDRVGNSIFESAHEVNIYAYMRFIRDPKAMPDEVLEEWAERRWPKCKDEMKRLATMGFEAVKRTQFIDESVAFHQNPPAPKFKYIKSCGICSIFRDGMDLHRTERMWGMLSDRKTPGRAAIRAEKDEAVRLANEGLRLLETLKDRLDPAEYARQVRAWRNLVTVSAATREYVRCACAYFDDMDANDANAPRLEAAIAAADKAIAGLMKDPNRKIGGYIDSCSAMGEDMDVAYLYPLRWLCKEFLREYRAEYAARQKFLGRKDVVDFVIPGGIYDDVRSWRTAMHASYQSVDSGVPVRFAGNGIFPNGVVRIDFRDVPGTELEIDLDPSGAAREDCEIVKTVKDGRVTVSIGKKRGERYPAIRSVVQVRK